MFSALKTFFSKWVYGAEGVAAIEAAMVFPLLAVLLVGTYDMGSAILVGQKAIRASQVTADLVSRESDATCSIINEAVLGGTLALEPFNTTNYGVDIVSIGFDDDENAYIEWRETRNMTANPDVMSSVASLSGPNNGVIVVSIQYQYDPLFLGFSMGGFNVGVVPMREIAFARGRKAAIVTSSC